MLSVLTCVEKAAKTTKAQAKAEVEKVEKKVTRKPKKAAATVIVQSPFGHEIKTEEIIAKVGDVDSVYVRVDQNKLYWVKGEETGDIDLW